MSPAPATGASALSIGEVLTALRPEFPDTSISKLRFLESEGLVEPSRTPAGYRKYSYADVDRLRYVLAAQRDHYLPLKVIREHLQAIDSQGSVPCGPTLVPAEQLPAPEDFTPDVDSRITRAELLQRTGLSEQQLEAAEQYGLIARTSGGFYDAGAREVAGIVLELASFGLEPRHLRAYRTAADREISLFEQVVAPVVRQPGPESRGRAAETVRQMAALSVRLHTALVQAGLRDTLGG